MGRTLKKQQQMWGLDVICLGAMSQLKDEKAKEDSAQFNDLTGIRPQLAMLSTLVFHMILHVFLMILHMYFTWSSLHICSVFHMILTSLHMCSVFHIILHMYLVVLSISHDTSQASTCSVFLRMLHVHSVFFITLVMIHPHVEYSSWSSTCIPSGLWWPYHKFTTE